MNRLIFILLALVSFQFNLEAQLKKHLVLDPVNNSPSHYPKLEKKYKNKISEDLSLYSFDDKGIFSPLPAGLLKHATTQINIEEKNEFGFPIRFTGTTPVQSRSSNQNYWTSNLKSYIGIDQEDLGFNQYQQITDELNIKHTRLSVIYKGIPVMNSEFLIHEYPNNKLLGNGDIQLPDLKDVNPLINKEDAYASANQYLVQQAQKFIVPDERELFKQGLISSELVCYLNSNDKKWYLAYHQIIKPNVMNSWEIFVDAKTAQVIEAHTNMCKLHNHNVAEINAPAPSGPEVATAKDLFDVNRTFNTWKEGSTYYLIDGGQSMFKLASSKMPNNPVGAIWTVDGNNRSPARSGFTTNQISSSNNTWNNKTAVSAHYNALQAYNYFKNTHARNSIDGNGGTIRSYINVADENGGSMDNAFWDGEAMYYGNGKTAFTALAKGLDVAGHEMSHGVIQNTANLTYQNESGAINESFADIFGAMIDRNDWKMGEDVVNTQIFRSGALRDLSSPNNGTSQGGNGWQPKHVNEQYRGSEDNGGVHINSGITNLAFYLFVQEMAKSRTEEQAKSIAEKIYYRALERYLTRSSNFKDLRKAIQDATTDLQGANSAELTAVGKSFDAVGIVGQSTGGNNGTNYQKDLKPNPGKEYVLCTDQDQHGIYLIDIPGNQTFELSTDDIISKPSISDDGSEIYYIAKDNSLRALYLNSSKGIYEPFVLDQSPIYRNVVVSKDAGLLAVLSKAENNLISIYNFTSQTWKDFTLYNPTYTEGVKTGTVRYADFMDFDHSGQYVMYDAYSEVQDQSGSNYSYWDIGFLNVFNVGAKTFGDGKIEKLFSDIPEGTSIGNPVFSKNSPYIIAFDYIEDDLFGSNYAVLGSNVETGETQAIAENRSDLAYPNYNLQDSRVMFNGYTSNSTKIDNITVQANKILGSGSVSLLVDGGYWGSYFGTGKRSLLANDDIKTLSNIEYNPNPSRDLVHFTFNSNNQQDITFRILNNKGEIISTVSKIAHSGYNDISLNVTSLCNGLYFVNMQNLEINETVKIVVLH